MQLQALLKTDPNLPQTDTVISDIMNSHFTEEEVTNSIQELKSKKACGLDGVPCEAIKAASPLIVSRLTSFFNYVIDIGEYPTSWAEGLSFPIPKGGDKRDPKNYSTWQVI